MSPGTSGIFRSGFFLLCCSFTGTRRLKPLRAGKISPWLYMRNPGIVTVWCKSLVANFGLVLGCIEADASKQILILQHCSRSTRFANLCTAPNSKFQQKIVHNFCKLNIHPNLKRLVLGCINADFCNQILILQHFSRSTRFANLCTAPN